MDSTSCTGFLRLMGYKFILLVTYVVTDLLVCRNRVGGGGVMMKITIISGPIPTGGSMGVGVELRVKSQRGGADIYMKTHISGKCPSDPFPCIFECLFSDFWGACVLYFCVIRTINELCPLMFSYQCFRIPIRILFLD